MNKIISIDATYFYFITSIIKINIMKKLVLILFTAGLIFYGCNEEIFPETFILGLEKDYQVNKNYQSDDNALKFEITVINDSRCPSDVVCIWQGEAVVKIEVKAPTKGTIELSTFDNLTDTVGLYSFELVNVAPYPVSTRTIDPDDYDVTLMINKLESGN